jgi:NAD(P)-dependent dehydrogenase (short-subunit alcohol dehydrogenase family)
METPMSIFDLSGRVAVITGGNGGIGLGIAQALATAGCNVSIWGRNADKNKSAAATMAGCAGKADTRVCDVTDPASVKSAMAATLEKFGRVDGCFANAGIGGGGRHAFIDRTEEQWRSMSDFGGIAVYLMSKASSYHTADCFVIDGGYTAF